MFRRDPELGVDGWGRFVIVAAVIGFLLVGDKAPVLGVGD